MPAANLHTSFGHSSQSWEKLQGKSDTLLSEKSQKAVCQKLYPEQECQLHAALCKTYPSLFQKPQSCLYF